MPSQNPYRICAGLPAVPKQNQCGLALKHHRSCTGAHSNPVSLHAGPLQGLYRISAGAHTETLRAPTQKHCGRPRRNTAGAHVETLRAPMLNHCGHLQDLCRRPRRKLWAHTETLIFSAYVFFYELYRDSGWVK